MAIYTGQNDFGMEGIAMRKLVCKHPNKTAVDGYDADKLIYWDCPDCGAGWRAEPKTEKELAMAANISAGIADLDKLMMTRPSTFLGMQLSSLFGKLEMEQAVEFIIKECAKEDSWASAFNIFSFETDDQKHGFTFLLYYRWMEEDGSGNHFVVDRELIEKLEKRRGEG